MFFSKEYANMVCSDGKQYFYIASEDFVMPVVMTKKAFFRSALFPTEPYNYGGLSSCKDFLDSVCEYLKKKEKVHWISQNPPASLFSDFPTGAKHIPFGSHVVDLSLAEDELWAKLHSKHRNVIKKAEKDGIVITKGVSDKIISDYHSIDLDTWARSEKKAANLAALKHQAEKLGDKVVFYMAYEEDDPQSGAIFYYNKEMCYYMHGANKNNPHTGSGNLLQWKAMLDMKEKGVKYFSFVGCRINEDENSKFHGIQRFKERFGGELKQGYLFKLDFNPFRHCLFNFLLAFRNLIKGNHKFVIQKDIIDQEIHKWPQQ